MYIYIGIIYVKACIIYVRADENHNCSHIHIVSSCILCVSECAKERKNQVRVCVCVWEREGGKKEKEKACVHASINVWSEWE